MKLPVSSISLFLAAATAQSVIESSSFGHGQRISPYKDSIPGWQIGGEGHVPPILSDKIILTPPYPGITRGYAWAQTPVMQPEWSAEFQFRASGQERGGGNLQLWFAKDGQSKIGASSIYTVGQFDGFALAVDSHGGRGGTIRGFLNDGTTDYKRHRSVDSLAFGHCDYPYRNLGRPSVVRIKQTNSVLEVTVDGKTCFATNKVALPAGNTFGITAATPENPDSFEIFKLAVESIQTGAPPPVQQQQQQQQQPLAGRDNPAPPQNQQPGFPNQDLVNRFQQVTDATNNALREMSNQNIKTDNRHNDLLREVHNLDSRMQKMEQALQVVLRDLEGKDYRGSFVQLQETLRSSHLSLSENLQGHVLDVITSSTPRMGFFITMIILVQLFLAGSYILYKRRRANMPKKFL